MDATDRYIRALREGDDDSIESAQEAMHAADKLVTVLEALKALLVACEGADIIAGAASIYDASVAARAAIAEAEK